MKKKIQQEQLLNYFDLLLRVTFKRNEKNKFNYYVTRERKRDRDRKGG